MKNSEKVFKRGAKLLTENPAKFDETIKQMKEMGLLIETSEGVKLTAKGREYHKQQSAALDQNN